MKSYDRWLLDEFENRLNSSNDYSLRKFSKDLGISPAFLSLVFNGKKEINQKTAKEILISLEIPEPVKFSILKNYEVIEKKRAKIKTRIKKIFTAEKEELRTFRLKINDICPMDLLIYKIVYKYFTKLSPEERTSLEKIVSSLHTEVFLPLGKIQGCIEYFLEMDLITKFEAEYVACFEIVIFEDSFAQGDDTEEFQKMAELALDSFQPDKSKNDTLATYIQAETRGCDYIEHEFYSLDQESFLEFQRKMSELIENLENIEQAASHGERDICCLNYMLTNI